MVEPTYPDLSLWFGTECSHFFEYISRFNQCYSFSKNIPVSASVFRRKWIFVYTCASFLHENMQEAGFFWATRTIGTHPPTPGSRAASTADPARWTRRAATHTHMEAAHRHTPSWSVGRSEQENSKTSCVLSLERHEEKGLYDLLFLGNPCTHVCSPWSTTNSQCIMHTAGSFSP